MIINIMVQYPFEQFLFFALFAVFGHFWAFLAFLGFQWGLGGILEMLVSYKITRGIKLVVGRINDWF